ncbi:MAG: protein kinase [Myxococcales bacterium]|nr:protein kinase [Myxococcales bacterium]
MQQKMPVPGDVVGERYVVERLLAEGGMGAVFVARHKHTEAVVALKVLRDETSADELTRVRFVREAKVAAALGHPGIVKVFDAGDDPSAGPYLAMELLEGEPLDSYIQRANPSLQERLAIVREMLEPLAAAHEAGIVHRDVKPENVFLASDGEGGVRVKLLDFGIARVQHATTQTSDGSALGTIYYMAPEQMMDARRASPAADVWAVGVLLFELVADVLPFDGQTIHEVAVRVCTAPIPSLAEAAPSVDPALVDIVHACLDRAVEKRPQNARELAAMLDAIGIVAPRAMRVSAVASARASVTPSALRSIVPTPTPTSTAVVSKETIEIGPDGNRPARRDSVAIEAPPTAVDRPSRATSRKPMAAILIACALFGAGAVGAVTVRSMRANREMAQSARSPVVATSARTESTPAPVAPPTVQAPATPVATPPALVPVERPTPPPVASPETRVVVRAPSNAGRVARVQAPSNATSTGPTAVVARAPEPTPVAQPTPVVQPAVPPVVQPVAPPVVQPAQTPARVASAPATQPATQPTVTTVTTRPAQPVVQPRPAAQPVRRPPEGEDEAPLSF